MDSSPNMTGVFKHQGLYRDQTIDSAAVRDGVTFMSVLLGTNHPPMIQTAPPGCVYYPELDPNPIKIKILDGGKGSVLLTDGEETSEPKLMDGDKISESKLMDGEETSEAKLIEEDETSDLNESDDSDIDPYDFFESDNPEKMPSLPVYRWPKLIKEDKFLAKHNKPVTVIISVPSHKEHDHIRPQLLPLKVMSRAETVSSVKKRIRKKIGLPETSLLKLCGKNGKMRDNATLAFYNIRKKETLFLSFVCNDWDKMAKYD